MFHKSQLTDLSLGNGNRRGDNVTLFPGFSNITLIKSSRARANFSHILGPVLPEFLYILFFK